METEGVSRPAQALADRFVWSTGCAGSLSGMWVGLAWPGRVYVMKKFIGRFCSRRSWPCPWTSVPHRAPVFPFFIFTTVMWGRHRCRGVKRQKAQTSPTPCEKAVNPGILACKSVRRWGREKETRLWKWPRVCAISCKCLLYLRASEGESRDGAEGKEYVCRLHVRSATLSLQNIIDLHPLLSGIRSA